MTAQLYRIPAMIKDSMVNFLAGFGVPGLDKATAQRFVWLPLDQEQLTAAYRGNWLCRKIIDAPAFDSCRAWRSWEAENDQIEKLEETEKRIGLQRKLMQGLTKARLYGGAALVIGVDGQKFEEELDPESVGRDELVFVHVLSRWEITAGEVVKDITSPWYGEPSYYRRENAAVLPSAQVKPPVEASGLGYDPGSSLTIHPSRVVRLIGLDYPDLLHDQDGWGDSALSPVVEAVKNAGLVNSSIASMIAEAKLDIIKVPGLLEMISTDDGTRRLKDRFSFSMAAKSTVNATLIDGNEEWERIALTFANMDGVMGMYLNIAAGAADIPSTRLLGREPAGMNATGASDIRNYYDRLQSDQKVRVQPALERLDEVVIRSALGSRPDEVHYNWNPLWQMDEEQKSNIWLRKAQTHKIDAELGLINPDVLREVRANQCIEDGFYPGMEAAIEEHDLEPEEDENDELDLEMKNLEMERAGVEIEGMKQEQRFAKANGGKPPKKNGAAKPKPFG